MAADSNEDTRIGTDEAPGDGSQSRIGLWAGLGLLAIVAVVILLMLTQCTSRVPDVVGLSLSAATTALEDSGYKVGTVTYTAGDESNANTVTEQSPEAGAKADRDTAVDLTIARDPRSAQGLDDAGIDLGSPDTSSDESTTSVGNVNAGSGSGSSGSSTGPTNPFTRAYPNASASSSGGDIYVRLSPGSASRRVTSGSAWDTAPQVSPNGTYVVFLRASGSGGRPTQVGIVNLTTMNPSILELPISTLSPARNVWYGSPVFAPQEDSTALQSEWLVIPQMLGVRAEVGGRLLVCNVWIQSSWAAWNIGLRDSSAIALSPSPVAGCVRVNATSLSGGIGYSADFNCYNGWFTER